MAAWAVPFGLASAALHALLVATRHDFRHVPQLWHDATVSVGAVGALGAIALGTAGAWIACRRAGLPLGPVAGAAAPALLFGLAVGNLGHWWLQQNYGPPSSWWWAVQISPTDRVPGYENYATFQPVFVYESLWAIVIGFGVIWAGAAVRFVGLADLPAARPPVTPQATSRQSRSLSDLCHISSASRPAGLPIWWSSPEPWLVYTSPGQEARHQRGRILKLIW